MNNSFNIVLCSDFKSIQGLLERVVYICPDHGRWPDFNFKTYGRLKVYISGEIIYATDILVAVKDSHSSSYYGVGNVEDLEGFKLLNSSEEDNIFCLLPGIDRYRDIVDSLGVDLSQDILSSLNDVVYMSKTNKRRRLYYEAESSEVFIKSFMRNSESFFAFHNAGDILDGLIHEGFGYISENLTLKFKLDGFENAHKINLKYKHDGIIPKRINILIGENGVGKSQALNSFICSVMQKKNCNGQLVDHNLKDGRPMINRILAIATPGETKNTYPSDNVINPNVFYKRLILTRNSRSRNNRAIGKSLIQLVRANQSIGGTNRWDIFITSLSEAMPIDKIVIPLDEPLGENSYISLTDLSDNWHEENVLNIWSRVKDSAEPKIIGENGIHPMSSGQLSFFKFALLATLYIENGSFVLLDEPETHLHPSFISGFIKLLDDILEKTGSYSLIAMHSPYFVREVTREQVHIFKVIDDRIITIQHPRLKTFGANVGDISYFVFGEDYDNNLSDKLINKAVKQGYSYDLIKENYSSELPTEILHSIKMRLDGEF